MVQDFADRSSELVREGWDHLRAGRPIAARACWQRAIQVDGSAAASKAIERLERSGDLPASARARYRLRAPADPSRRSAWDDRLGGTDLDGMADAFGRLAADDPTDASAWYNRAVVLAWLGSNREAISALDRVVAIEAATAPDHAVEAATLAELLRAGGGAETLADDLRFSCTIDGPAIDPDVLLAEFPTIRKIETPQAPGLDAAPEVQVFEWLDRLLPEAGTLAATALPVVLASLVIRPTGGLRLSSPRAETIEAAEEVLLGRLGIGAESARREAAPLPLPFLDADVWTVRMAPGLDPEHADALRRDWVEHYYEDLWVRRPRQSLGGRNPLDTAEAAHRGDPEARARLTAVVAFREQLGQRPSARLLYQGYPFDRLRRRLGLAADDPDAVDPSDLSCAPAWELAALDPGSLDDHRLGDAVASAVGLGVDPITAPLADELLRRGLPTDGSIRIGAVGAIVRRAMAVDDASRALVAMDQARTSADPATAEILGVWRAEVLSRSGRPDEALATYQTMVSADPRGAAIALEGAETLLDNGHADQALRLLHVARYLGGEWTVRRAIRWLSDLGDWPPPPSSS